MHQAREQSLNGICSHNQASTDKWSHQYKAFQLSICRIQRSKSANCFQYHKGTYWLYWSSFIRRLGDQDQLSYRCKGNVRDISGCISWTQNHLHRYTQLDTDFYRNLHRNAGLDHSNYQYNSYFRIFSRMLDDSYKNPCYYNRHSILQDISEHTPFYHHYRDLHTHTDHKKHTITHKSILLQLLCRSNNRHMF